MLPLQIALGLKVLFNWGKGLIVTITFCVEPLQVFAVVVYTYVTSIGELVVLLNVSLTLPVPVVPDWLMPAIVARLQLNVEPAVALVAV